MALGEVIGLNFVPLPACAVEPSRMVQAELLTASVGEVTALVHISRHKTERVGVETQHTHTDKETVMCLTVPLSLETRTSLLLLLFRVSTRLEIIIVLCLKLPAKT